ncbi:hypothetical protein QJ857_gp0019 [Tupanvirus soda lake]|uniref:Inositol polyphosphate-related phosphatase domain-containing protein n=2 Tax=Tupanvirus TaxID=2094720 RepID=A0A6N1NSJ2_9VIRU|nr:hypothetical protein QJ857_gp0019 [Tupanvirus soda lake]QKU34668.1 hypothetical protein [Tupanvirus soda lake]
MSLKVAVFTFNTEAQVFCCSCNEKKSCGLARKLISYVSTDCVRTDFVNEYINYISAQNAGLPDVFIIGLQESSMSNPKKGFKSDQLLFAFKDCVSKINPNYVLVKEKLEGIGAEGIRGLRIGLLINKNFTTDFSFYFYKPLFESSLKISEGQHFGKGAILLELKVIKDAKNYHMHFINTHLPFLEKLNDQGKEIRDKTLQETLQSFEKKLKNETSESITKFIMGDLNYRIDFNNDEDISKKFIEQLNKNELNIDNINQYKDYDQLRKTLNSDLIAYKEGINNDGPTFLPTCKLEKKCPIPKDGRKYQTSKGKTIRIPSWCDRILYSGNINCKLYQRFDSGFTCKSDHIPVIGLYEILSIDQEITTTQPTNQPNQSVKIQTTIESDKTTKQTGGDIYYDKYLKYKKKYIDLKHLEV